MTKKIKLLILSLFLGLTFNGLKSSNEEGSGDADKSFLAEMNRVQDLIQGGGGTHRTIGLTARSCQVPNQIKSGLIELLEDGFSSEKLLVFGYDAAQINEAKAVLAQQEQGKMDSIRTQTSRYLDGRFAVRAPKNQNQPASETSFEDSAKKSNLITLLRDGFSSKNLLEFGFNDAQINEAKAVLVEEEQRKMDSIRTQSSRYPYGGRLAVRAPRSQDQSMAATSFEDSAQKSSLITLLRDGFSSKHLLEFGFNDAQINEARAVLAEEEQRKVDIIRTQNQDQPMSAASTSSLKRGSTLSNLSLSGTDPFPHAKTAITAKILEGRAKEAHLSKYDLAGQDLTQSELIELVEEGLTSSRDLIDCGFSVEQIRQAQEVINNRRKRRRTARDSFDSSTFVKQARNQNQPTSKTPIAARQKLLLNTCSPETNPVSHVQTAITTKRLKDSAQESHLFKYAMLGNLEKLQELHRRGTNIFTKNEYGLSIRKVAAQAHTRAWDNRSKSENIPGLRAFHDEEMMKHNKVMKWYDSLLLQQKHL